MMKKETIAYLIFTACLLYIISPWFFARKLLLNEFISLTGFLILAHKRFRVSNDPISICVIFLLLWSALHAIISLFRMDAIYYYLRNLVIVYSVMAFFIGFYCFPFLGKYLRKIRSLLRLYIGIFIFIRLPRFLFERFGMAVLFPALFKKASFKWLPHVLVALNIIYGIVYDAFTILILSVFYILLFLSPGYKFFIRFLFVCLLLFSIIFIYLQPNLSIISKRYSPYNTIGIHDVINSHPLLAVDGNNTWRLVLWKQIIVDHFPENLFGLGFGTPALQYYPVEEARKIPSLPYVLGAHNSYVYLFGRLGLAYLLLAGLIYWVIIKEYFKFKRYYVANNQELIFLSFFAISIIALFNTVLESPVYAAGYWLLLGFTARCISDRKRSRSKNEDTIHT
jgi:O-Antigen ligase